MDSLNSIVFSPPNLSSSNQTLVYERYSKDVDTRLEDPIPSIKVISLGDPGVGKSCLIRRYCEKKFTVEYISTIGIDYGVKTIILHGEPLKIHFWDMAGHSSYFHVRNEFYGDTNGILLIFDVRSKDTFVRLSAWIQEFKHYIKSPIITFLVGNKVFLPINTFEY
ncbi:DnaJ sub C member 27 [Coelomomyces lativittatus]|nr:DnaJ sub C member 27 [Coelomomyces lativittatus]